MGYRYLKLQMFPFAVAVLSHLGTIVERRKRSPLEDPVKNAACLTNVSAPKGSNKEEFGV